MSVAVREAGFLTARAAAAAAGAAVHIVAYSTQVGSGVRYVTKFSEVCYWLYRRLSVE